MHRALLFLLVATSLALDDYPAYLKPEGRPLILSHRGDSGQFPDHTEAGYSSAHYGGTDFNEVDLQVTSDGRLVASHDPVLKSHTDIADFPEFADRMRKEIWIPSKSLRFKDDWLINDFTLEEIKKLRTNNRMEG